MSYLGCKSDLLKTGVWDVDLVHTEPFPSACADLFRAQ